MQWKFKFLSFRKLMAPLVVVLILIRVLFYFGLPRLPLYTPPFHQPAPGQTGDLVFKFTTHSPHCVAAELAQRTGRALNEMPSDYVPADLEIAAHVPAGYAPATPDGLMVMLNAPDQPPSDSMKAILDEKHLIFALIRAPDCPSWQKAGYVIDTVFNMGSRYTIDPHRIYLVDVEDHGLGSFSVADVVTGIVPLRAFVIFEFRFEAANGQILGFGPDETHLPPPVLMKQMLKDAFVVTLRPDLKNDDYDFQVPLALQRAGIRHVKILTMAPQANTYPNLDPDWLRTTIGFLDDSQKQEPEAKMLSFATTMPSEETSPSAQ